MTGLVLFFYSIIFSKHYTESLNDTVYIYTYTSVYLSKKLRAIWTMQLCVSRQDCFLDSCVMKKFTYGVNKSLIIEHVLKTRVPSVLLYTKANLRSGLCGSCQVSGTMTIKDENMERNSTFPNRKQCSSAK